MNSSATSNESAIPFIESLLPQISGEKLPSNRQALQVLFYNTRQLHISLEDAARLVINEIKVFWLKANVPTQDDHKCKAKLMTLYEDYRKNQKNVGRASNAKKNQELHEYLSELFDISHGSFRNLLKEKERQILFLQSISDIAHRKTALESNGSSGVQFDKNENQNECPMDQTNDGEEDETDYPDEVVQSVMLLSKYDIEKIIMGEESLEAAASNLTAMDELSQEFENFSSNESQRTSQSSENVQGSQGTSSSNFSLKGRNYDVKGIRGKINVISDNVVSALDNCKVSYRNSVHIIAAVAHSLGHDIKNLILNKSSINRARAKIRKKLAEKIKTLFQEKEIDFVIVLWDGKIISDLYTGKKFDVVPILVSSNNVHKIIDVPTLANGKAATLASAIYEALSEWGLDEKVEALCCDTTNANLGRKAGAAVLLESLLEKDLLYLACRHHVMEVILSACFTLNFPGTSGPNEPLFKRFQDSWENIDKSVYHNGLKDMDARLKDKVEEISEFAEKFLNEEMPRDDYKELLQLSLKFLGKGSEINFRKPGACHHARWMAKAIYCLKIYLFRNSFKLNKKVEKNLLKLCQFIVFIYIESWYTAPLSIDAPENDLKLIKRLYDYESIDPSISVAALNKIQNHLWYLTPECAAMSFFNKNISQEIKKKMVEALNLNMDDENDPPKKLYIHSDAHMRELKEKNMDYFINGHSLEFFKRFNLNKDFLNQDVATWEKDDKYKKSREIVSQLVVVNDMSERAVHLAEDYANILTTKKDQTNYLLQVVEDFKKQCPDSNKGTVQKKLKTH